MCIIAAKMKGSGMPKREYLKNCFDNNSDGAGLMYVDNGDVVIEKGFMRWEDFNKRLDELCFIYDDFKNKSLVMHFRIGTQGKNDGHTCHPFPITSKHKLLRRLNLRTDIGMVHNGIIDEYSVHTYSSGYSYSKYYHTKDALLSDTQLFIRYCVSAFKSLNRNFYKNAQVMQCLDKIADGKLCFLDKNDDIYILGTYEEHEGVLYSNSTYKPRLPIAYKAPSLYTYGYDEYDDAYVYGEYIKGMEQEDNDEVSTTPYISPYSYEGYYVTEVMDYLTPLEKGMSFLSMDDNIYTASNDEEFWVDEEIGWLYKMDGHGIMHYMCAGEIIMEG